MYTKRNEPMNYGVVFMVEIQILTTTSIFKCIYDVNER